MLPPLPDVVGYRHWKSQVVNLIVQASARPDQTTVVQWIMMAFDVSSTVDTLTLSRTPSTLISLDGKVAIAVHHILNAAGVKGKSVQHQINLKMQDELENYQRIL